MKSSLPGSEALDDYEIERAIGSGACGVVYLARDRRSGRACALKEFPTTSGATKQLFREISALFSVDHPNIVRCLDFIHRASSGRHYLVFEYAEGGSLRDLLAQRCRLAPAEALEILQQIAQGVKHAHERQLIHCDLKPENILVHREQGRDLFKIADLGIARHLSNLEERRASAGSPAYMAPEQFYDEATCASDLYALGILFYEMLAGHTPFEYSNERLWVAHLKESPDYTPIVHPGCRALIDQLLRKQPQDRPRDADALLAAIEALRTPRVAPAPFAPPPPTPRMAPHTAEIAAIRRREIPGGRALHVIDGSLFISDGQGTDLYDASRDSLLPRFLRGSVSASAGAWFATPAAMHMFETATRTVTTRFVPQTPVDAIALDPQRRHVYYADTHRLYCSSESGELQWSVACRNYFVQPRLRVLRHGLVLVSSGPVNPCITAWTATGEPAWRIDLAAPVLALVVEEDDFSIVTMGLGSSEPSLLLSFRGPHEHQRTELPADVHVAYDHAPFLTVHRATPTGTVVAAVDVRGGTVTDLCTLPGRSLGEAWLGNDQFALLERSGRTSRLHLFEVRRKVDDREAC